MKIRLESKSSGLAELELYADTPEERAVFEKIRDSGFCRSASEDREGLVAVYVQILSPEFEREIRHCSRQTVDTLDAVRAFLAPLANRGSELQRHALADTDVRITHIEETPRCPDCGADTVPHGAVFDCPNCGTRVGG